jgi:hypothetical protein
MKIIGLISEYGFKGEAAMEFLDFNKKTGIGLSASEKDKLLEYLKNGETIAISPIAIKSLYENENNVLGSLSYLTDGFWIWPSYLTYYFETNGVGLHDEFIGYVKGINYQRTALNEEKVSEAIKTIKNLL